MANLYVRALLLGGVLALALAALTHTGSADAATKRATVIAQIDDLRTETWRWQRLMQKPRTPTNFSERRTTSHAYRAWVRNLWRNRAERAERQAANPPHERAWRCIHRYERDPRQGWRTHTGNGFYGGLQMNIAFQREYAPRLLKRKGTANRWTPLEQMWVAERAHRSGRGFHPWPNTARYCGLI